jgi:hypothetical protein
MPFRIAIVPTRTSPIVDVPALVGASGERRRVSSGIDAIKAPPLFSPARTKNLS